MEDGGSALHPSNRLLTDPGRSFPWTRLADLTLTFETLIGIPVAKPSKTPAPAAKMKLLKQKMLALGYSVSTDNRPGHLLDGTFDAPLIRAYNVFKHRWDMPETNKPRVLDVTPPDEATVDLIVQGIDLILSRPFRPRVP